MKHDWEYKKLGDVLIFDKRFSGIPKEEQPTTINFVHVSAETLKLLQTAEGDVKLLSTGNFCGRTTIELAGKYLNNGEVVSIPTGGVANIKYHNGYFVDSGNILGVSSNPQIYLRYVYYAMIAKNELINSFFRGASIKHPYMPDIYKIAIPIPQRHIQEQIVSELDKVSEIIEKKKQQVKELDNLAQSIFYDMFGDPVENEKGWEVKKTKDFGEVKIGPFGSLLHKSDYISGGIPLVNPIHMRDGKIFVDNNFTISESKAKELSSYLMQEGDFVFARRGEIGRCAIVRNCDNGCLCGTGSLFVRFSQMMDRLFLRYVVNSKSFVAELVDKAKGATMLNINCGIVEELRIPNPPLSLQQAFAEKVEGIERQKELITASIKEAETLFDSRMEYWFGE